MAAFSLLNTCYVNTITGVALAREQGVLKRPRGTPLPAWTYLVGRLGSALVTSVIALTVIVTLAVAAFDVTVSWRTIGYLTGIGAVSFLLLGLAVVAAVPKSETALPATRAMETAFLPTTDSWPMSTTAMLTVGAWSVAAVVVIGLTFRWEPGAVRLGRR